MEAVLRVTDALKSFRETRLSTLRTPAEFFDIHRISRPADFNTAVSRLTYNTRYFSGNYTLIVAALAVYSIIASPLLLLSLVFLFGGFAAINRFEEVYGQFVTQKTLYTGLFVIGIPLLWFSSPFMTLFWLIGASACLILTHACLIEPGVESEYANIEGAV
ncbi:prenylated rab acceptor PRA1 [Suillus plorans]|uniref:PRA1 family protein n=1 Tax=Suillus plorans TaxID=116603 RepID=A0A9P7J217_9AGAM|nr:prenylated rab acceptor PRA1 [Suillus plorans]KAG1799702.1 prenylated rab acceptor PRA1 [Suillus plorans]KAG1832529.1 prenylated rab acceptor PRA1 [Suillus variegatus]KAG1862887.1 prenylated rab acceptor PRA1 [Suillus tomentosus]KAG2055859.1 prenylated rab acceptor PRA1 [Suillus hirtellus]